MRGEFCIGIAAFLSFMSLLLLIFLQVGQINTSTIPRSIAMVIVDTAGYGQALEALILNPVAGLYTSNASAPLQIAAGLRLNYNFGLYSYCAYVDTKAGICSNTTVGQRYMPYDIITADMSSNYSILSAPFIPNNSFRDSKYLGDSSKAAYALLLLGTISIGVSFFLGVVKNRRTFLTSACCATIGAFMLLISASIWAVIINKSKAINNVLLKPPSSTEIGIGISVSAGNGLYLSWAAFSFAFVSIIPYMINWYTYRG